MYLCLIVSITDIILGILYSSEYFCSNIFNESNWFFVKSIISCLLFYTCYIYIDNSTQINTVKQVLLCITLACMEPILTTGVMLFKCKYTHIDIILLDLMYSGIIYFYCFVWILKLDYYIKTNNNILSTNI